MIRWITERLGTAPYNGLTEGPWLVLDVRHLVDKSGNGPEQVREIIDKGVAAYRKSRSVIVACDLGISRSNTIAAGILSIVEKISYDQAVRTVTAKTSEREIKLDLVETVRRAIGQASSRINRETVLVTGASGFIGQHLIDRLKQTCNVKAPPRSELNLESGAVTFADFCAQAEIGQIVHLAYPREYTNATSVASALTNLRVIIDTCRLLDIRLVFISSWVVFSGYSTAEMAADEATPFRPKGIYAETKYLEECLVELYYRTGQIRRAICRLSPVYGPGGLRPRFIQTFFDAMVKGHTFTTHHFRNGRPALDLLYVSDAAAALAAVVKLPDNEVFHFGSGSLRSTAEIARLIGDIVGKPLFHSEIEIDDFTSNIVFPAAKARRLLDWAPAIDIEAGLKNTLVSAARVKF